MSIAGDYYAELLVALAAGPPAELDAAATLLHDAARAGGTIYTFGNGASAALASHATTDLGKRLGVRVVSLVDNAALLTAYANDENYECVFAEPLRRLLRDADVALGISGSGTSPNVLAALELARREGARSILLTGTMAGSEDADACYDVVVRAPVEPIEQIEDLHVVFCHILMRLLAERLGR